MKAPVPTFPLLEYSSCLACPRIPMMSPSRDVQTGKMSATNLRAVYCEFDPGVANTMNPEASAGNLARQASEYLKRLTDSRP